MSFPKAATVLMSVFLATTAHADEDIGPVDLCRDVSQIANQIMTARQKNRPMSETIPVAADGIMGWSDKYELEMTAGKAEEAAADMVMAAYEQSIQPVERHQRLEITEFENAVFKECYESATSDSDVDDISPLRRPDLPLQGTFRDAVPESTSGMWAIQVGSFSSQENAEALAADLRRQGYAAFLSKVESDAGSIHRVRIGPQKDMASLESTAAGLVEAGYKGEIVPHP